MEQVHNLGDPRLTGYCVYCGGPAETRDHAPSKVFLDPPYPENLPWVDACLRCNNSLSSDEAYLASLVECAAVGASATADVERPKIRALLEQSPGLAQRIWSARVERGTQVEFAPEAARVVKVITKLARAHSAFELNLPMLRAPDGLWVGTLSSLGAEQLEVFEAVPPMTLFPEAGSRALQRVMVVHVAGSQFLVYDWLDVQEDRYRYYARQEADRLVVRGVIREYLGFEVVWAG